MQVLTETNFPKEIQVSFTTKSFPHKTPETPFTVPSEMTRFGLSELVNHLLRDDLSGEIVPFEFLVEYREGKKVFLRTSLAKFFVKIQQYPESVITLEYVESTPPPKHVDTIPHDDWVSAISRQVDFSSKSDTEYVFSGSYDGVVRLMEFPLKKNQKSTSDNNTSAASGQVLLKTHALSSPITSIHGYLNKSGDELMRYVVSCQDETLRLYTVRKQQQQQQEGSNKLRVDLKVRFKGHEDTITSTDINSSLTMCCTGSDDKTVRIWDLKNFGAAVSSTNDDEDESQPKKKRRVNVEVAEGQPVAKLAGHILGVSHVKYSPVGDAIISAGMDHTIRTHDLTTGSNSNTIHGSKPATCIAPHVQFSTNPIILSSYPDHIVRLHDSRVAGKAQIFKSHKAWVRGVQWINKSGDASSDVTSFFSWGDDNHLKVWDLRSAVPVHSFKHSDKEQSRWVSDWKVLAGCAISDGILSGGSDCMLKKHLV